MDAVRARTPSRLIPIDTTELAWQRARCRTSAHLFFQLVARRYERGSLLITTNQLVTQWGAVFGDEALAAAILDRLLHHSHTLMIHGDSYRLKQKRKAGLIPAVPRREGALAGEPASADRRKH